MQALLDSSPNPFEGDLELRKKYNEINTRKLAKAYLKVKPNDLEEEGFKRALALFKEAANRVPAYKDFLKEHKVNPNKIKTKEDFKQVPSIHKNNYIRKYKLNELLWDGDISKYYMMSSSSGSTGDPFFWPRSTYQEIDGALMSESIYREFYQIDNKETLYVIGFAMGTWIAGPYMLAATEMVAQKRSNIICVTPGTTKKLFITIVKDLAPKFKTIILAGYPPIIKDIIDEAKDYGLKWSKYNVKTFFAGETFSEKYREHIIRKTGAKNHYTDCISVYGSAEGAILGHETPITTLIRKQSENNQKLSQRLFKETVVPSLMQYNPLVKYFEAEDEKLLFTTYSGIPLIRYAIGDSGGIYRQDQMVNIFQEEGLSIRDLARDLSLQKFLWKLPFVYLFGRTDLTIIFYGANIYPENIRIVLDQKHWENKLSGKFNMSVEEDKNHDKRIVISIERSKDVKESEINVKKLEEEVFKNLKKTNSEFNIILKSIGNKATPLVSTVKYGQFQIGIKHRWVKR